MEESITAKIIHAVVFLMICAIVVSLGWNEPLQYRFMSTQEIALLENPPPPPRPTPPPAWIDVRKTPTRLNDPAQMSPGGGNSTQSRPSVNR